MDIFAEREDVAAVQALVVDGVDETTGEEDAESADGAFLDGEGGIGIRHGGWVEGYALVADDELQAALVGEGLDADVASGAGRVGVADDIRHYLLNGELQASGETLLNAEAL